MSDRSTSAGTRRSRLRWLAPVVVMACILAATSWPTPPSMPHNSDKVVHFTAYSSLGAAFGWAAGTRSFRRMMLWIGIVSLLGGADEWHQQFIPSRSMDVRDWLADTAGAVTGLSLVTALTRRRESVA